MKTTPPDHPDATYVGAYLLTDGRWVSYWAAPDGTALHGVSSLPGQAQFVTAGARYRDYEAALAGIAELISGHNSDQRVKAHSELLAAAAELMAALGPDSVGPPANEGPVDTLTAQSAYDLLTGLAAA